MILAHTVLNLTAKFTLPLFAGADYQLVWWVWAVVFWIAAGTVVLIHPPQAPEEPS